MTSFAAIANSQFASITWWLEDMNFIFSCSKKIVYSLGLFTKFCFYHSKIKVISLHCRIIIVYVQLKPAISNSQVKRKVIRNNRSLK